MRTFKYLEFFSVYLFNIYKILYLWMQSTMFYFISNNHVFKYLSYISGFKLIFKHKKNVQFSTQRIYKKNQQRTPKQHRKTIIKFQIKKCLSSISAEKVSTNICNPSSVNKPKDLHTDLQRIIVRWLCYRFNEKCIYFMKTIIQNYQLYFKTLNVQLSISINVSNEKRGYLYLELAATPLASLGSVFQELVKGKKWPKTILKHI